MKLRASRHIHALSVWLVELTETAFLPNVSSSCTTLSLLQSFQCAIAWEVPKQLSLNAVNRLPRLSGGYFPKASAKLQLLCIITKNLNPKIIFFLHNLTLIKIMTAQNKHREPIYTSAHIIILKRLSLKESS